jgi:hypothetical protein
VISKAWKDDPRTLETQTFASPKVSQNPNNSESRRHLESKATIQIDPSNSVAHYRLATLYRREGKMQQADKEVCAIQEVQRNERPATKSFS